MELDNLYTIIKTKHFKFLYNRFKNEFSFVKNRITKYYNIKKIKKCHNLCRNIRASANRPSANGKTSEQGTNPNGIERIMFEPFEEGSKRTNSIFKKSA